MRVLITRPAHLATALAEKITNMGDIAELFPVIDIQKTPHQAALQSAINTLDRQDIAIFVSQSAVQFGMPVIQARWPKLPNILWAAIGPGTANALREHGISKVLLPAAPPYESESLLALAEFQPPHINKKKIVLFRGNGGRELLSEALTARGATVNIIETYQRLLPTPKKLDWHPRNIDVIVTTSADCLNNLVKLAGNAIADLKAVPIVVVGTRMQALANMLNFKSPLLATDADDASIIKVLKTFKDNHS